MRYNTEYTAAYQILLESAQTTKISVGNEVEFNTDYLYLLGKKARELLQKRIQVGTVISIDAQNNCKVKWTDQHGIVVPGFADVWSKKFLVRSINDEWEERNERLARKINDEFGKNFVVISIGSGDDVRFYDEDTEEGFIITWNKEAAAFVTSNRKYAGREWDDVEDAVDSMIETGII